MTWKRFSILIHAHKRHRFALGMRVFVYVWLDVLNNVGEEDCMRRDVAPAWHRAQLRPLARCLACFAWPERVTTLSVRERDEESGGGSVSSCNVACVSSR